MIRDTLLPELGRRFLSVDLRLDAATNPIATIAAKHPAVGNITIYDDGDEATVVIGKITHEHHNPYDQSLSETERDQWITQSVVNFLDTLFADRVLLWTSRSGHSGGSMEINGALTTDDLEELKTYASPEPLVFLWSGPVDR